MIQATHFVIDKGWRIMGKDLGINEREVLRRANLPEDLFSRKNATLTTKEYFALWNSLEASVDDPGFPLTLGRMIQVEAFNPPIFAAFCSPNMKVAVERLKLYKQLIGPMVLKIDEHGTYTTIIIDCLYTDFPMPDSLIAMELVFLVHLFRLATRENIKPLFVSGAASMLKHKPYTEYFGVAPEMGKSNRLRFSAADMLRPFLSENKAMWEFFEPELNKRLSEIGSHATFSQKVRSCLLELLPSGLCSAEDVAKKLAVSKRSLQRYLREENTSFQKELNATREKLARHYLKNQELSGAQISFLLGFSDPNSFVRAFHSWTGETPGKLRQRILV